jgi:hypothetical protein
MNSYFWSRSDRHFRSIDYRAGLVVSDSFSFPHHTRSVFKLHRGETACGIRSILSTRKWIWKRFVRQRQHSVETHTPNKSLEATAGRRVESLLIS